MAKKHKKVMYPPCPQVGHFCFCPPLSCGGALRDGKGYVASLPICGQLLILSPALMRRGSPRRQGLCSHLAHLWATSDLVPRSEVEGLPETAGVM